MATLEEARERTGMIFGVGIDLNLKVIENPHLNNPGFRSEASLKNHFVNVMYSTYLPIQGN